MTFREKYDRSSNWQTRIIVMELFHLTMRNRERWTIKKTAQYFGTSVGLTCENLKIAEYIHTRPDIANCQNRQDALIKLGMIRPKP